MKKIFKAFSVGLFALLSASQAYADLNNFVCDASRRLSCCTLDCRHWYVAGNLGVSHLYDKHTPGIPSSVDENGPGWDADLGYQWNSILGAELGYTQYYNSRETIGTGLAPIVLAKSTHFAVHLNGTARYPIVDCFSVLGKLGVAYSYVQKTFTTAGFSASSGAVSPFLGLGLDYSVTPRADIVAQWGFVRGNDHTGSSTLYSLGVVYAIV